MRKTCLINIINNILKKHFRMLKLFHILQIDIIIKVKINIKIK